MESVSPYNRAVLALKRAIAAVLNAVRRVLGSIFQLIFADRLGNISRQTERLGAASVESVTHLGGEVRSLDQRLAAIERELAAIRDLLEGRGASSAAKSEGVAVRHNGD